MIQVEVPLKCSLKFPWDQVLLNRNHESMGSHGVSRLPRWLSGKESASAGATGDKDSIPGLGRSPGDGIWQPTPVFLPGKSHGQRNSAGYSAWSHKELDMTERLSTWSLQMVSLRYWQVISLLCLPASPSSWWGFNVAIKWTHLCFLSKMIYWNLRCGQCCCVTHESFLKFRLTRMCWNELCHSFWKLSIVPSTQGKISCNSAKPPILDNHGKTCLKDYSLKKKDNSVFFCYVVEISVSNCRSVVL